MDWRAIALGVAFVAMWSSAFTSAHVVVSYAPPFLALTVRFLVSGLIALAIGRALGQRAPRDRAQWIAVAVFGLCQNALYLGLNFLALQTLDASVAVIIASLLPISVAGLAWLVFGERPTPLAAAGLAAGVAGVLVIMTARLQEGADPVAAGLCLGALLALSIATLLVRGASGGGDLWMIVGLQMLVGSLLLFPVAVLFEDWQVRLDGVRWRWPSATPCCFPASPRR